MIRFILNELIDTEESYNKLLLLIRTRYMEPMIAASKKKFPLVKESDIPILFNHLPALLKLSNEILIRCKTSTNIGEIFRDLESDLVVFHKYAAHYRSKTKTIRKACNNVLFLKIDQENLARKDTNRLGMSDYFIAPIQRIPRYCLLLKDLQKYTNKQVPQYYDLEYALNSLTQLAVTMDHVKMKISPPLPSRHTN
ncbi:Dbl homology domain-containing protein [Pilobolus umbonatus]|nr:Dbl homology domain-containing protein [Pilobolus umbonatus]